MTLTQQQVRTYYNASYRMLLLSLRIGARVALAGALLLAAAFAQTEPAEEPKNPSPVTLTQFAPGGAL